MASALIFLSGCAGGGGTEHIPPKGIVAGHATLLELQVSAWGAGRGQITSRYQKVMCHYRQVDRVIGKSNFIPLLMKPRNESETKAPTGKEGSFQCVLPPFPETTQAVEYYFDFTFDGYQQSRPHITVPVLNGLRPGEESNEPLIRYLVEQQVEKMDLKKLLSIMAGPASPQQEFVAQRLGFLTPFSDEAVLALARASKGDESFIASEAKSSLVHIMGQHFSKCLSCLIRNGYFKTAIYTLIASGQGRFKYWVKTCLSAL